MKLTTFLLARASKAHIEWAEGKKRETFSWTNQYNNSQQPESSSEADVTLIFLFQFQPRRLTISPRSSAWRMSTSRLHDIEKRVQWIFDRVFWSRDLSVCTTVSPLSRVVVELLLCCRRHQIIHEHDLAMWRHRPERSDDIINSNRRSRKEASALTMNLIKSNCGFLEIVKSRSTLRIAGQPAARARERDDEKPF